MFEKILVVDDDVDIRSKFYKTLSSLGYRVTSVSTEKEAFLKLAEERPNLILLDEIMPGEGGISTAKKIREFDKDVEIIILLDGEMTEEKTEIVKSLNIRDIVKKDFSTHFMMKRILEILKEKEDLKTVGAFPEVTKELILVVDDNPEIREVLWTFLTKKGYKVLDASSGEEAITQIKMATTNRPKIVFLDIRMPKMDGILVLREIKEVDESIKVIMLTSVQEEYIMNEAKKAGACDYLVKPCDLHKLDILLTSLLIPDRTGENKD